MLSLIAVVTAATMSLSHMASADPADAGAFTVHLDPKGDDTANGETPDTAVRTLDRAQRLLVAAEPKTDVEIRIAPGEYVAATTRWTYYVPGKSVRFLPADYESGDGIDDIASRPVFRGDGSAGYWLSARLPEGDSGGDTNLDFRYLQVEGYATGALQFHGGVKENAEGITVPAGDGVNNNTVYGMKFRELGSKHVSAGSGFGALNTWNSSGNVVRNNHFESNENDDAEAGLLHAIYLAHHSDDNEIVGNRFDTVSGGPIRTRNDSNDNLIHDNTFTRAGDDGYSEWFCDKRCVDENPGHGRECASHGNVFGDNVLESAYRGGEMNTWKLSPGDIDYPGGTGCDNEDQPRVRTYGNT